MKKKQKQDAKTVAFVALGCPKNIVDSEKMLAVIGQAGFILVEDADDADVVVINTCGFIKPAKDEAFEAIKAAVGQKKRGNVKKVIVAGCLPQRMGAELAKEIEGIDAIAGLGARDDIADIISHSLAQRGRRQKTAICLEYPDNLIHDDTGRLLITPRHSVYLRISEGCDRNCTFCTIPSIRGRFRSKPPEKIIDEARELVKNGAVELIIIGQDTTSYGKDLGLTNGLSKLIKRLNELEQLRWLRLMYLYPAGIDDGLIETVACTQKVVNYIDIPLQHINNRILSDMGRGRQKAKIIDLIEKLRAAMCDVVLRTTMIVGFPGETDEQFEELSDFVRAVKFDALGCFPFYAEQGTPAAKMAGQVEENVKNERVERLMLAQQQIAFEKGRGHVGQELLCLIDRLEDDRFVLGRFYGQAPQIDGICYIEDAATGISAIDKNIKQKRAYPAIVSVKPGDFIRAKVVAGRDYDLVCRAIL